MRLSVGEIRLILANMSKEMATMERQKVVTHHTAMQFEYFRSTLDKKILELLSKRKE